VHVLTPTLLSIIVQGEQLRCHRLQTPSETKRLWRTRGTAQRLNGGEAAKTHGRHQPQGHRQGQFFRSEARKHGPGLGLPFREAR